MNSAFRGVAAVMKARAQAISTTAQAISTRPHSNFHHENPTSTPTQAISHASTLVSTTVRAISIRSEQQFNASTVISIGKQQRHFTPNDTSRYPDAVSKLLIM